MLGHPTPWKQLPEGHGGRAHAATAAVSRALVALQLGGGETPSTRDHQLEDTTCIIFFFVNRKLLLCWNTRCFVFPL